MCQIRKVRGKQETVTTYNVTTNLHIYLEMTSEDVETPFIYFANVCVENLKKTEIICV